MVEETAGATNEGDIEKSDAVDVEVTEDVRSNLKERLQFFYSNSNLRQDKFMREFIFRNEGIPVHALLRFKTISKHTKDAQVLLKVARELEDLLVVSADSKSIMRKTPFTKENMNEHVPLTLYVKNIPVSDGRHGVTVEDFKKLFDDYEGLVLVKLCYKQIHPSPHRGKSRKSPKRIAHTSALVEFDSVEHMEAAASKLLTLKDGKEVEPEVKLELNGRVLTVETLSEHQKNDEAEKKDNKRKDDEDEEKTTTTEDNDKGESSFTLDWKPKCVISLTGLAASCDREAISEAVGKCLDITVDAVKEKKIYIDFSRGQEDGAIRFVEPGHDVETVAKKLSSGDVLVAEEKVKEVTILEGDAEKEYWDKYIEFKNNQMKQRSQERHKKRRKRY